MGGDIRVSVIVPVYNAKDTLDRMMRSVLGQTLRAIEVIAVDDGSRDASGAMLDEYARRDARVLAVHRENGGAASARNDAIRRARGKYLYFADADDWLETDMLARMADLADAHDLQLTISGFYIRTGGHGGREHICVRAAEDRVYETRCAFREDAYRLFDLNLLYPPWNKLYRTDYVRARGFSFPDTFWDDFPFNLAVLRDIERVGVMSAPLYHFTRAREDSETAKYRKDMYQKREEEHAWMLDLYAHWGLLEDPALEMIYRRYIERIIGCIENAVNTSDALTIREKLRAIRSILDGEQVAPALKYAHPRSPYMKLMLIPLRIRSAHLCYLEGATIARVKANNARLFAALKANR
jgi:glycosyltransferase EpsJ